MDKERRKGLWINLLPWLRKDTQAQACVRGDPEWRPRDDIVWSWSLDCLGDSKMLEMPEPWDLLRRAANREWNQPKRKKCAAVNKAERSWRSEERFDIRHGDAVWSLSSWLSVCLWSSISLPCLLPYVLGVVMYILYHYMLKVCDMLFDFDFTGDYS